MVSAPPLQPPVSPSPRHDGWHARRPPRSTATSHFLPKRPGGVLSFRLATRYEPSSPRSVLASYPGSDTSLPGPCCRQHRCGGRRPSAMSRAKLPYDLCASEGKRRCGLAGHPFESPPRAQELDPRGARGLSVDLSAPRLRRASAAVRLWRRPHCVPSSCQGAAGCWGLIDRRGRRDNRSG